ncbi:MAG: hypothetical protein AAGE01_25795 [Pseudomonadota bacterium]
MKPLAATARGFAAATLLLTSALATPAAFAQDEERFIGLMSSYISLANAVVDTAERPETAIYLAIEGIFEVYEQRRDAPAAVKHLERLLDAHGDNQTVRNLIRFKLRDIYKETGRQEEALAQLDLIVAENAAVTGDR